MKFEPFDKVKVVKSLCYRENVFLDFTDEILIPVGSVCKVSRISDRYVFVDVIKFPKGWVSSEHCSGHHGIPADSLELAHRPIATIRRLEDQA